MDLIEPQPKPKFFLKPLSKSNFKTASTWVLPSLNSEATTCNSQRNKQSYDISLKLGSMLNGDSLSTIHIPESSVKQRASFLTDNQNTGIVPKKKIISALQQTFRRVQTNQTDNNIVDRSGSISRRTTKFHKVEAEYRMSPYLSVLRYTAEQEQQTKDNQIQINKMIDDLKPDEPLTLGQLAIKAAEERTQKRTLLIQKASKRYNSRIYKVLSFIKF